MCIEFIYVIRWRKATGWEKDRQHDPTEKNLFVNKRLQHVSRSMTAALTSKLRNIFLRVTSEINLGT